MEQIRQRLGVDSLHYLSIDGMVKATGFERESFCLACFTNHYPIPLPDALHLGKNLLERPAGSDGCDPGPDAEYEPLLEAAARRPGAPAGEPTTQGRIPAKPGAFPIGDPGRQE